MGLCSKQVTSDSRHGWNQSLVQANTTFELPKPPSMKGQSSSSSSSSSSLQQQEQSQPLKCPRCDSSNTKFCYYNNYNKSQPRHFCKACKRHWTQGGTLRNVPVGGGRKNKRPKTSNTTASKTTTLSLLNNGNNGIFVGSSSIPCVPKIDQDHLDLFSYSNLDDFESNPCSISSTISCSNLYNYTRDHQGNDGLEEIVMNSLSNTSMGSNSMMSDHHHHQQWRLPSTTITTSSFIDMSSNNFGWDVDLDNFVSVDDDLTMPWDDLEIKPPCLWANNNRSC